MSLSPSSLENPTMQAAVEQQRPDVDINFGREVRDAASALVEASLNTAASLARIFFSREVKLSERFDDNGSYFSDPYAVDGSYFEPTSLIE